jgi:hypothetical protein
MGRMPVTRRAGLGSWAPVSIIAFAIWLLAGHPATLWFLWVAGPYSLIVPGRWLAGGLRD